MSEFKKFVSNGYIQWITEAPNGTIKTVLYADGDIFNQCNDSCDNKLLLEHRSKVEKGLTKIQRKLGNIRTALLYAPVSLWFVGLVTIWNSKIHMMESLILSTLSLGIFPIARLFLLQLFKHKLMTKLI